MHMFFNRIYAVLLLPMSILHNILYTVYVIYLFDLAQRNKQNAKSSELLMLTRHNANYKVKEENFDNDLCRYTNKQTVIFSF